MKDDYPLFRKWYNFLDWIMDKVEKFPKNVKFTLSDRIINLSFNILDGITEAIHGARKKDILGNVSLSIEKLRIYFRLSKDRKYISIKQYEYFCLNMEEIGKMVGGWLKSCKE